MEEDKNNKENKFKTSYEFLKAYDFTLKKAANSLYGKSDFQCCTRVDLRCEECPFEEHSDECTDPSCKVGAGFERTFEEWQEWFYNLTGNKDDRPKEMFLEKNENVKKPTEQAEQEIQTNEDNVEKITYQQAKEIAGNYFLGNIANVAQTNFEVFTKELEAKIKAKYEIEYLTLDSDEPQTKYVRKVVDLLTHIQQWYQEAIKWNLIANGDVSKIPPDFKDIYIKVYDPEEGVVLFQDEHTLKSKGLKLAWTRDN